MDILTTSNLSVYTPALLRNCWSASSLPTDALSNEVVMQKTTHTHTRMRVVVQRVTNASVSVANELVSEINKGLAVLVGISREDTQEDAKYMARKVVNTRFWDSEEKKWNLSAKSADLEVMLISQFTLYSVMKGNKLDFHNAMAPEQAREFFDTFCELVRKEYGKPDRIKMGAFGEMMQVSLTNDGPVTIVLDSKNRKE